MVYQYIQVVYGVLVDHTRFLQIYKEKLCALRNKHKDLPTWEERGEYFDGDSYAKELCKTMDLGDLDWANDIYWDLIHELDCIFPYHCCSDLANKFWVIGVRSSNLKPTVILHNVICLEELVEDLEVSDKWNEIAREYHLADLLPRTYLLLDDCTWCT